MMSDEISAKDVRANSGEDTFHVVKSEVDKKKAKRVAVVLYYLWDLLNETSIINDFKRDKSCKHFVPNFVPIRTVDRRH